MTPLARLRLLDSAERRKREHARRFAAVLLADLCAAKRALAR